MCGIFGFNSYDSLSARQIKTISKNVWKSLSRRGPDGHGGVYFSPNPIQYKINDFEANDSSNLFLLHTRLSIIGLDDSGSQPMAGNLGRYWIVFNGEIYNYRELRSEIASFGVVFKSNTDTEVIREGFGIWGQSFFRRLEGMFAIVVFDTLKKELFLARDEIGIKPLYYARCPKGGIIFSSEQEAIFESGIIKPEPNWAGLISNYQFNGALRPNTVYKGVFAVRPGTYLVCKDFIISETRFTNFLSSVDRVSGVSINCKSAITALDKLTSESVKKTLVSDVEVATLLSGGIDSALIAAYACEYRSNLKAYTLAWEEKDSSSGSEINRAKFIADLLGLDLKVVSVTPKDVEDSFEQIFDLYEEPMGMIEPHYFIAKRLREDGIKVVLNGIGPDETLGGYGWYSAQEKFKKFKKYAFIFNLCQNLSYKNQKRRKILSSKDWIEFYSRVFQRFPVPADEIFSQDISRDIFWEDELRLNYGEPPQKISDMQYLNYLDLKVYLGTHHNHSCDKFLMHQGIEGRFPYLSREWIEFTYSLPDYLKVNKGQNKWILHKLSEKFFPKDYFRVVKKGFGVPNDFLSKSKKFAKLSEVSTLNLVKKNIIRKDIGQILDKISDDESFTLRAYLVSLDLWIKKVM